MDSWYESIGLFFVEHLCMTSRHFGWLFFCTPQRGIFSCRKKPGAIFVGSNLWFTALQDYVGALEDLDLALQIEPENPFPQCCRTEADT